jgi:DNA invertase Pin-like site-specific DNA recombinase
MIKTKMMEMIIGYARVSTDGQTLDAQHAALIAAGAEKVFAEKISGVVTDRKALARAIAALGEGMFCWSLAWIAWRDQLAICSACWTL